MKTTQQEHQLKAWENQDQSAQTLQDVKALARLVSKAAHQTKAQTEYAEILHDRMQGTAKKLTLVTNGIEDRFSNYDRQLKVLEDQLRESRRPVILWGVVAAIVTAITINLLIAPRPVPQSAEIAPQVNQSQGVK